jgi:phosphate transport system protein
MARLHTDRVYEAELHKLREQLLLMGAKVEEMIAASMRALVERDSDLAQRMIDADDEIDQLEVEIDELCLRILARRQPVASDLRFLTTSLKLVTNLERIGDLGVNICERVLELKAEPPLKPYVDLPRMADAAQAMVRETLDAFVAGDAERADRVTEQDRKVDELYNQIFRELLTYMMEDTGNIYRATRLQSIAKYLERIGDHATNLAEEVVFMIKGKDIRHRGHERSENRPHRPMRGVLFLCVQNACRSQVAEAWAHELLPNSLKVFSAGTHPSELNPWAARVMQEVGIDLAKQRAKPLSEIPLAEVDLVVTLCDDQLCPSLPDSTSREVWPIADPTRISGDEARLLEAFRRTRDEIRRKVEALAAR